LDRRLVEIAPHAEEQIQALGLVLSVEHVTNSATAACDGSAFQTPGPVWHKKDKEAGVVPDGLHGLDQEADWIQSGYHGWGYGYKAHATIRVSSKVRVVLDATVTGSACESQVLDDRRARLPETIETLLLDAGYDDGDLIARLAAQGIVALVPLAKDIGVSTAQDRRERAAYLASEAGHAWYQQRGTSIEPFFGTIKAFFHLDPLPVQGKVKASAYILMAFYAWNLIVLFHWLSDCPLGAVKAVLDCM
jgi:IS5 family transposase